MTIQLDCYYSLSSPWAYFAGPQLQDVVRRHRVKLALKPYDFQAVVVQTGGIPIRTRPQPRRSYHAEELARWRDYLGMPLTLEPKHYPQSMPADPDWNKYAGWMVIAAQQQVRHDVRGGIAADRRVAGFDRRPQVLRTEVRRRGEKHDVAGFDHALEGVEAGLPHPLQRLRPPVTARLRLRHLLFLLTLWSVTGCRLGRHLARMIPAIDQGPALGKLPEMAGEGALDPAEHRNRLLAAQAEAEAAAAAKLAAGEAATLAARRSQISGAPEDLERTSGLIALAMGIGAAT